MEMNEAHIRSLKATVQVVEEKIQEIEVLLDHHSKIPNAALEIIDDLTSGERQMLIHQIAKMRQLLKEYRSCYGLNDHRERSLKGIISVKASFLWEELSGATFDRLQGYGSTAAADRSKYEQQLEAMTKVANNLIIKQ
jgi:hypothetical protein